MDRAHVSAPTARGLAVVSLVLAHAAIVAVVVLVAGLAGLESRIDASAAPQVEMDDAPAHSQLARTLAAHAPDRQR